MANAKIDLPIDVRLAEIMALLRRHQVVIVEAETGAGKTTRLPQAWLEAFDGPAVMTQTRRAAVRWNGRRIAEELACQPGDLVGWRLRGEPTIMSAATRLVLMMDQSLINRIQEERKLPSGLIIIDEAHERSIAIDLLLGLVKQLLPESPDTKVIVTSATIDTAKFSRYYDGAPVVSVRGRVFPVSTEILRMLRYEHHSQCAARAAELTLGRFLEGTLETPTADGQGRQAVSSGTVLVLLPGKEDIRQVMEVILNAAKAAGAADRVQVIACHGESTPDEQDAVQAPVPAGTIRFVCGTEVLRNSVTVRSTVGVIDSLEVKRLIVTPQGVAHLTKITVSKAEADQAKGRAGRTAPGIYIAVSFDSEYEMLKPYPQPAILREPITHVVLQVAAFGLDIRIFPLIDHPTEAHIEAAIRRLQRVGALDSQEKITEIGRLLLQFPIDPERAKALLVGDDLGVLPEAVIVLAALDTEGFFHRPKDRVGKVLVDETVAKQIMRQVIKDDRGWTRRLLPCSTEEVNLSELPDWAVRKGELVEINCGANGFPNTEGTRWVADLIRYQWADGSQSDFAAIVRAYRAFKAEERRLQAANAANPKPKTGTKRGRSREAQLRDWCIRHSVNYKRLRAAEAVMRDICEELASSPLGPVHGLATGREFDAEALTVALASGMLDNLAFYNADVRQYVGPVGTFELGYGSVARGAEFVLAASISKVTGRRGSTFYLADLAAKADAQRLLVVVPGLRVVNVGCNPRYDSAQDEVVSTTETWFNGQLVKSHEVPDPNHAEAARLRREGRNLRAWQTWANKPEIAMPDPADDAAVIPGIVVCTYGADVEDGTPLVAYGVASRWYPSDPWFRAAWTRDEMEARHWHEQAIIKLAIIRAEAKATAERQQREAEVQRLRQKAGPVCARVEKLYNEHYYDLSHGLRNSLQNYQWIPFSDDIEAWITNAKVLVAEAEEFLAEKRRQTERAAAEAVRKLAELVETAKTRRDVVNGLLFEHRNVFDDELYERLVQLDVDDDALPVTIERLEAWIAEADAAIAEANSSRLADKVDLSALAARYRPGRI
jgi:HrpA-like RNA helicase